MKKQSDLIIPGKLLFASFVLCMSVVFLRSADAQAPAPPAAPAVDKAAAERGKGDFSSSCSFCHGSLATGTEQAPNLLRSPLVFQDHNGDTLGPFLKQGRPTLGMPAFPTLSALAYPGSPRHPAPGNCVAGG
jgi:mono/diheme cytochrome c family protein